MASTILLQTTQGFLDITGDPVRADGYYGYPDSLYTIAITTQNFIGRIAIQASLALSPQDTDWFDVQLLPPNNYMDFPLIPASPTGQNGGDTGTQGFSFRGNYLYLRTVITRSQIYQGLTQDQIDALGTTRIVLSQSQTTYSSSTTLPPITGFTQLSNSGAGYQIYAGQNTAGIPVFRTLTAGTGITISQTATTLTFSVSNTGTDSDSGSDNDVDDSGTEFESGDTFITLDDTPASYIGFANSLLQVNSAGTGIIFNTLPALATSGNLVDATGVLGVAQGGTGLQALTPNGLLVSDSTGNILNSVIAPTVANSILTYNGTTFAWQTLANLGGTGNPPSYPTVNFELDLGSYTTTPAVTSLLGNVGVIALSDLVAGGVAPLYSNITLMTTGNTLTLTGIEQNVIIRKPVGSITVISLPANPLSGTTFVIKDGKGDANINNITINGNSKTIDGLTSKIISTPYACLKIIYDGIGWNII